MFAEIHDYFEKVKTEVEDGFVAGRKALEADIKAAINDAKVTALHEVAANAPDIQAAVQKALGELEQAVLAALASHVI